ncbi:MAG: SDR family oxidoreductase, partial [Chitinophagaceae bacterium]
MQKIILVTGINGLLGQYLSVRLFQSNISLHGLGKGKCRLEHTDKLIYHTVDIGNQEKVEKVMQEVKPHIIIHAAAMTNVDDCELKQQDAFYINVEATKYLLQAAKNIDIHQPHFIFISTDFIFKGDCGPYLEDALPDPVNYYGKTKLWGEF